MKNAGAIAILFAGLVIAASARAADGLAPGSLAAPPMAPMDVAAGFPVDLPTALPDSVAPGVDMAGGRCDNCPPPRKYDRQDIVRTRSDLHRRIKTINTYEFAEPGRIEQGGIRVRSDVTLVNFVVHRYRVIYAPALVDASDAPDSYAPPPVHRVNRGCGYSRYDRYGPCRRMLRARD